MDDAPEYNILSKNLNFSELDIDKYLRIIMNEDGADWTFVCPSESGGNRITTKWI
jgi:hypothetical protein